MSQYKPQYTITDKARRLKSQIIKYEKREAPIIHVTNQMLYDARVRSVHSTLAIENISLIYTEVADIIGDKYVPLTPNEIRAVKNAYQAYSLIDPYHPPNPYSAVDLLHAHHVFMSGLAKEAGRFRAAKLVQRRIGNLLDWVKDSEEHPLIKSCVFHYEFMCIQPFSAGNGRIARLWHILLLYHWIMPLGLPLTDIISNRRQEYLDALESCTKFIEYMLQVIKDAAVEFDKDLIR